VISPASVRASAAPESEQEELVRRWEAAVVAVNQFIEDGQLTELPDFQLELTEHGMLLWREGATEAADFAVKCTAWGRIVVASGYTAQERSWGFVVGPRGEGEPAVANTFFRTQVAPRSISSLGGLILHEAVHTVEGSGTVSFFSGLAYYWHSLFKGGSAEHPHERLAYEVEARFYAWWRMQRD